MELITWKRRPPSPPLVSQHRWCPSRILSWSYRHGLRDRIGGTGPEDISFTYLSGSSVPLPRFSQGAAEEIRAESLRLWNMCPPLLSFSQIVEREGGKWLVGYFLQRESGEETLSHSKYVFLQSNIKSWIRRVHQVQALRVYPLPKLPLIVMYLNLTKIHNRV